MSKRREITVFSLSAIDLFCSALGVFMVLCIIVFPYYKKEAPTPASEPEPEVAPPPTPAPPEPAPTPKVIPSITVAMNWQVEVKRHNGSVDWISTTSDDVDLYVDAPGSDGRVLRYSYKQKRHAGEPALYLVDSTRGGGEVWVHPKAISGTYKVSFSIYSKGRVTDVARVLRYRVLLTVVTPEGTTESINTTEGPMRPYVFSDREFVPRPDKLYHMVDIVIGADGSVSLGGGDR